MIDRRGWQRSDSQRIEAYKHCDRSRFILWFEGKLLQGVSRGFYFTASEYPDAAGSEPVYLGHHDGCAYFTAELGQLPSAFDNHRLTGLRAACIGVDALERTLLFHARGMLNWHQRQAFCSFCGHLMQSTHAGHARQCSNPDCARIHYPKIDPAVIFSVTSEQQGTPKILLARKKEWDDHRYSVLAGFIEPGETPEDSVAREAYEETGLTVREVEYIAAQPWPFPDALMLGFSCRTDENDITLLDGELERAAWFSADEIEQGLARERFQMPFEQSIAWYLINRWFAEIKGYDLPRTS